VAPLDGDVTSVRCRPNTLLKATPTPSRKKVNKVCEVCGTAGVMNCYCLHGSRGVARVKTYGEVLREYEFHLGAKIADSKGKPSGKQTFRLLRRRHVRVNRIIYIGRESNRLEEIEAGVIHSPESVYTEYPDPSRDEWQTRILPILEKTPIAALMRISGRSRSMLRRALAGRSRPRRRNQEQLKSVLHRLGLI
jgi:hypothetical protein